MKTTVEEKQIETAIKEIQDRLLRAFLVLYYERGHYGRTIQISELHKTLELYGFDDLDASTELMLRKAIEIVRSINVYKRRKG